MASKPKIYGFNERDAAVLAGMAQSKRRTATNRTKSTSFDLEDKTLRFIAKTGNTAITARVDDTPGMGTVTVYWVDPSTGQMTPRLDVNGDEVTAIVLNWTASTSGTNTYVWVGYDAFGTLWFENEDCG